MGLQQRDLFDQHPGTTWPEAVRDAAPPVSANAGAAYTMGKFADTVARQPQVMEDVIDGVALLGSAGLAYATAKEGDVLKAGATTIGLFAAFKMLRHTFRKGNRRPTGMQGRRQLPDSHTREKRLSGREHRASTPR
jgi:hypothetical protein